MTGASASTAVSVVWMALHRRAFSGDTDELGYLSAAWDDSQGARHHGLLGVWWAYISHLGFAPLVPVATVPIQLVTHNSLAASVGVEIAFLLLLLVAVAVIGSRLGGQIVSAVGVVGVAGMPAIIDFSRSYQFVIGATATYTAAVAALLLSDRMRRTAWSIGWGALLGLALLSRTMMIALVPGAIAAGLALALLPGSRRLRRLLNWAVGIVAMLGLASTWYVFSFSHVLDYLTTFGYGSRAGNYGVKRSILSTSYWLDKASLAATQFLDFPLSLLLLGGAVVGLALLVRLTIVSRGRWPELTPRRVDALSVAIVLAEGYVALSSSSNEGTGFEVPLLPCALVLAVSVLVSVAAIRTVVVVAVCATAALNVASKSGGFPSLAEHSTAGVLGIPALDGTTALDRYLASAEPGIPTAVGRLELASRWIPTAAALDDRLTTFALTRGRAPRVAMATRDPMLDTNSMTLACHYLFDAGQIPFLQLDGQTYGDTPAGYARELSDAQFTANLLVTGDPGPGEFRPYNTQAAVERAAAEAGFAPQFSFGLPDGRTYRIWWRDFGPLARYDAADTECHA